MEKAGPDLADPALIAEPAGFDAHRAVGPLQWSDHQRGWVVIGHGAAQEAFADRETLSADRIDPLERFAADQPVAFGKVVDLLRGWMIFRDPPAHTRLREPVRRAFTVRHVTGLQEVIARLANRVVDDLPVGEDVDLTASFARPFPAMVIGELLGLGAVDRDRLQEWSDVLASLVFAVSPQRGADTAPLVAAADAFDEHFGPRVRDAQKVGGDDLLARVASLDDADFSDRELVGLCTLLLFAGHETTTGLLSNALALLLDRPDLLAAHTTGTGVDLLRSVDELLRVHGPARTMVRRVARDHDREGRRLERGQNVFVSIAAANHDPSVFDDPATVDLRRDPNPHLGFGWGLHHCLGAHLARLEGAIALRTLLGRFAAEPVSIPRPVGSVLGLARSPVIARLAEQPRDAGRDEGVGSWK